MQHLKIHSYIMRVQDLFLLDRFFQLTVLLSEIRSSAVPWDVWILIFPDFWYNIYFFKSTFRLDYNYSKLPIEKGDFMCLSPLNAVFLNHILCFIVSNPDFHKVIYHYWCIIITYALSTVLGITKLTILDLFHIYGTLLIICLSYFREETLGIVINCTYSQLKTKLSWKKWIWQNLPLFKNMMIY